MKLASTSLAAGDLFVGDLVMPAAENYRTARAVEPDILDTRTWR
jgi:hypothetical protein